MFRAVCSFVSLAPRGFAVPMSASRHYSSAQSAFEKAQTDLKTLKEAPEIDVKLQIYALFKQATAGDVSGSRPGVMDFAGRAKFDAHSKLKGLSKDDAMTKYAGLVNGLLGEEASTPAAASVEGLPAVDGVDISIKDKVFSIRLNRASKKNAFTPQMLKGITDALRFASSSNATSVTVISAEGDFFSSGNDLGNFAKAATATKQELKQIATDGGVVLKNYIDAYINHDKPLIALCNGPAVGVGTTVLPLCDLVIASDTFWFQTPFSQLGQCPEGASSYTFPASMGPLKAAEVLLTGKKVSVQEAHALGVVTKIVPKAQFEEVAWKEVAAMASLPPESLRLNKILLRNVHRAAMNKANEARLNDCEFGDEVNLIVERWQSKECANAVANFFKRK